ncbi:MAG: hypothetical protein DYH17_14060 [Xanthomonadales bacterium PRO6]|nr:hypothetical protein [Xanthomonadales bacterium PRO6]
MRARPDSVRVGLATVPAEERAAALEAGGAALAERARVERWIDLPASLLDDGSVRVQVNLPQADRYVLQAAGEDRLRQYDADFTGDEVPAAIDPLRGAGLRAERDPALAGEIALLLRRRGEAPDAARWQRLLDRHPEILGAYDEQPIALSRPRVELAPLPPQAIEAVWLVDGIEAQVQAVPLRAGEWVGIRLDPLAHAVARALTVDLLLRLVRSGDLVPIEDAGLRWQDARGEHRLRSDVRGEAMLASVDRQRTLSLQLEFPAPPDELPRWPAQRELELVVDELFPDATATRRLTYTVEVEPLRWLLVQSASLPLDPVRSAGQPYPVFVLQQRVEGTWIDIAADYFRKLDEGLAVSLAVAGEFRVGAVLAPWTLVFSTAADTGRTSRDGLHRVRLDASSGHACELLLLHEGAPLPRAQVYAVGPLRGMPPQELVADLHGRVRLHGVNVDTLRVEVAGFEQQSVDVRGPSARVELRAE